MLNLTITLEKRPAKCTKGSIKSLVVDELFHLITAAFETTAQKENEKHKLRGE